MKPNYHVIIVGSGPAGLAAADILSGYGRRVLVIDENSHIGGQLLRTPLYATGKRFEPDRTKRAGGRLMARLKRAGVQVLSDTQVLGIYPGPTLIVQESRGQVTEYRGESLILAIGARERQLPFKGWTLPGVMSTGAAQILMKSSGILPGKNTLIGGCGPLILAVAAEILANQGKVRAVLDQSRAASKLGAITAGPALRPRLVEGAICLARLVAARVPIRQGVRIVEARGNHRLEAVVTARVDADGRIISGTELTCATDTLAVGYGFSPNIELAQQAGCRVKFNNDKGGWHVDVDDSMRTTAADIYAVGETTGIAGGGKSLIEGRIAAWSILGKQGLVDRQTSESSIRPLIRQRSQQVRYGRFLNRLCRLPPGCYTDIPDETTICRCEEVTMGDIRRQLNNDFTTMNGIKKATRCGMGNCQGRTCGPILFDILSARSPSLPPDAIGCTSARVPVKRVALGALAAMTIDTTQGDKQP
jgi:NADPH-dependent 2,4-dienoyl-CoA reductase/sulfur reductase-like enzyme/bacterioferritin-associated ferredoxin